MGRERERPEKLIFFDVEFLYWFLKTCETGFSNSQFFKCSATITLMHTRSECDLSGVGAMRRTRKERTDRCVAIAGWKRTVLSFRATFSSRVALSNCTLCGNSSRPHFNFGPLWLQLNENSYVWAPIWHQTQSRLIGLLRDSLAFAENDIRIVVSVLRKWICLFIFIARRLPSKYLLIRETALVTRVSEEITHESLHGFFEKLRPKLYIFSFGSDCSYQQIFKANSFVHSRMLLFCFS